jgi:hypothetical protein
MNETLNAVLMTAVVSILAWSIRELVTLGKSHEALKAKVDGQAERIEDLAPLPAVVAALKEAVDTLKRAVEKIGG